MTASAPLRMAEFRIQFGAISPPATVSLNPAQPITNLDLFGLIPLTYNSPLWVWQLGTPAPQPVTATVTSGFPFTVQVSSNGAGWLQVTPTSGGAGSTALTLTPNVSNLGAGTYSATVTLTENLPPDLAPLGSNTSSFTVTLNASAQPTLVDASGTTQFVVSPGGLAPAPSVITLTTNGTPAPFTASITPVSGGNWLSMTPSSGTTPGPLTLTANPAGLASGTYNSNLVVQGPNNTLTISISVGDRAHHCDRQPDLGLVYPRAGSGCCGGSAYHRAVDSTGESDAHVFGRHPIRRQLAHRGARPVWLGATERKRGQPRTWHGLPGHA